MFFWRSIFTASAQGVIYSVLLLFPFKILMRANHMDWYCAIQSL
jgi:hypothetical protein